MTVERLLEQVLKAWEGNDRMGKLAHATLEDGRTIPYVVVEDPPRGGMKHTYFAPDRSYVVQFFNDPEMARDSYLQQRLHAIIGRYNPTIPEQEGGAPGNDEKTAAYFARRFCWPTAIVQSPEFGIVCPAYAQNFLFDRGASYEYNLSGVDKRSTWFTTSRRKYLTKSQLGDFRAMLQISIALARSVRRMHQAGLAHSDLSNNNVLIDPQTGECVVIDIDSLVVPGIFPPEVIGTPGYIAPEVLTGLTMPHGHPARRLASAYTDLHALAVLIYEYLLQRHPLCGVKVYAEDKNENEFLMFGPKATFVEHPADTSNRPVKMKAGIRDLGPALEKLFCRAFVDGLHDPERRPSAMEWERGLEQTWELLQPCRDLTCDHKWYVMYRGDKLKCPFCGNPVTGQDILRLRFRAEMRGRAGIWMPCGETNVYHNMQLYPWHVYGNAYPNEKTLPDEQGEIYQANGTWYLANKNIEGLESPDGTSVTKGERMVLKDRMIFRICSRNKGLLVEVSISPSNYSNLAR